MNPFTARRRRRQAEADALAELQARQRYLREDVTVFGEELGELHLDTLTDTLDRDATAYYRQALESYERAKARLGSAATTADLEPVLHDLVTGRHQRACVLAIVAGEPLPDRLAECFFNPQHGPSAVEVSWTPPGGVERTVPVCRSDAQRLEQGDAPRMRLVVVGTRQVPLALARDAEDERFPAHVDERMVLDQRSRAHGKAGLYGAPFGTGGAGGGFGAGGGL